MTRKILVPIDVTNPAKKINDFLYPYKDVEKWKLKGIKSGKEWKFGMVILTTEINETDIRKKITTNGHEIETQEMLANYLKQYVALLPKYKVGNIVRLETDSTDLTFMLEYQSLTKAR